MFKVIMTKKGCPEEKYQDAETIIEDFNSLPLMLGFLISGDFSGFNSVQVIEVIEKVIFTLE